MVNHPTTSLRVTPVDRGGLSSLAERLVDGEQAFSPWEFLTKLYIRRWILLLCMVVPTILAVLATSLVPLTWTATTKILIRYSTNESVFLQNLIPGDRVALSGAASSEILTSLPTLEETVRRYHIREADLYRDSTKVVFGTLAGMMPKFLMPATPPGSPGDDDETTQIARTFQDSLVEASRSSSSGLAAKGRPIELLGKDSTLPQALKGDEVITVTVRAFNRNKVAEIVNGLAQTFIDEYYRISADDARRAYDFLSGLAAKSEAEIALYERDPDNAGLPIGADARVGGGDASIDRDNPEIAKLANDLATLKSELSRSQQLYRSDSPRIQRAQSEIATLEKSLMQQERLAVAKSVLQQIKVRRFQALNTESLYRNRLVPISILEPAVTPMPSGSARIVRYLISGVTGMLIGGVLGFGMVVVLGLVDQRLFTPADIEQSLKLPIFGWLPVLSMRGRRGPMLADVNGRTTVEAESGLLQVLARLDAAGMEGEENVIAITSATDREGKSLVSLLLANALARGGRSRILLIDADPVRGSLTTHFGQRGKPGLVDAAVTSRPLAEFILPTNLANVDLVPAGATEDRGRMGFYLQRLQELLVEARSRYRLVIIDTPSLRAGSEALICSMAADKVLVVVRFGATRRGEVSNFIHKLREIAVAPQGVILNARRKVLPNFLYRNT